MRPEESPLDLNNLPEEYGKQAVEESSTTTAASTETSRFKKKKNGKDESGKVYECRFCSLKFCKSQALGGHMNRHRQERETETLNRARQLVYSNEGLSTGVHLGLRDLNALGSSTPIQSTTFPSTTRNIINDPCLQFRPLYPRLPIQTTATPTLHPCIYPSSSYPPPTHHPSINGDYYIGHVLPNISPRPLHALESTYTCFGSHNLPIDGVRPPTIMSRDSSSLQANQMDGMNWSCRYGLGQHDGGDPSNDIDPSFP